MSKIITAKMRLKNKGREYLCVVARQVNYIWNEINNLTYNRWRRHNRWLTHFDVTKEFTKGASRYFLLPQASINLIAQEHHKDRKKAKRSKLRYRGKASSGWIPVRKDSIKHRQTQRGRKYQHVFRFYNKEFKTFKDRAIDGEIRFVTFTEENGKWFINVSYIPSSTPSCASNDCVGLDWGIRHLLTSSNNEHPKNEEEYHRAISEVENDIVGLQKRISRKEEYLRKKHNLGKNSRIPKRYYNANLKRDRAKLAKKAQKLKNLRKDFFHKTSTEIVDSYRTICMEKLNVKNMSKSSSGTVDNPGSNVKQKSGLNRAILRAAPYMLKEQIRYKIELRGGEFIEVNPAFSSQTCSRCGYCNKDNRSQSKFSCLSCGFEADADYNAAVNILNKGISS